MHRAACRILGNMLTFEQKLSNLAMLAVKVGVNLQEGQRLNLAGPIEAAELMREISRIAYEAGSPLVRVTYTDGQQDLARALYAREDTLDTVDMERVEANRVSMERGDALLRITGADPALMAAADPARVTRITKAERQASQASSQLIQKSWMPWSIVAFATPAWAARMFPELPQDEAVSKLWDAIFQATRADVEDPLAAWDDHLNMLSRAREHLQSRGYSALRLTGPGTDLRLGLAEKHLWESGGLHSQKTGQFFVANMPTEEVFTAPHASRVDGVISSSKPLSYQGQLIDNFQLTFKDGAVVEAKAGQGEALLNQLLDMDPGARRLGEIALVPHESPISQSGLLFFNTLFDENAACHVALGRAYETCFEDGANRSQESLKADGFNDSMVHVDFMFGSSELNVDGELPDGTLEPVMRGGAWSF